VLGLITGSGFYDIPELVDRAVVGVETPFGGPVAVTTGTWRARPVCFLARHGTNHSIPPHAINYRANVSALKAVGATSVLATAVSGSMNPAMPPGSLVLISDFLNFTSGREVTFFDGTGRPVVAGDPPGPTVVHTDMTSPYDPDLRALVRRAAVEEEIDLADGAVYCTADGPRFETPAEIRMMAALGGDLVGMTGYPEVALAVEAGLAYASIGVVSNLAAGIGAEPLSSDDILGLVAGVADPLHRLIGRTVELAGDPGADPAGDPA
jgi:5'-methylthioadenosine phosphorylase